MKKFICLLASLLFFVACENKMQSTKAEEGVESNHRIDVKEIESQEISNIQKAEELALAGEQLMTPTTFQFASVIFDKALIYDSNNQKAIFYKAINAPFVNMKGILKRVEPLLKKDSVNYEKFLDHVANDSYLQAQKDFLYDGEGDIDSELKLQVFLDEQAKLYDDMRNVMKSMRDKSLVLNIPKSLWRDVDSSRARICEMKVIEPNVYERKCKSDVNLYKMSLERADFTTLQQVAAGLQIYNLVGGLYNLNGFHDLFLKYRGESLSQYRDDQLIEEVNSKEGLAELRDNNLAKVKNLGMDAIAGTSWALEVQDKICGKAEGYREARKDESYKQYYEWIVWDNEKRTYKTDPQTGMYVYERRYIFQNDTIRRPGFLFETGICIPEKSNRDDLAKALNTENNTGKVLKALELALSGNIMTLNYKDKNGNSRKTHVNYAQAFDNPIQDLKSIPKSFNHCGNVASVNNKSLNGVFVDGDAEEVGKNAGIINRTNCE